MGSDEQAQGEQRDVTRLLLRASEGDREAREALLPEVYGVLRAIAGRRMAHERVDHTLQPTALVHEAYLRLFGKAPLTWKDRRHFYATAALAMRRILVEHARARARLKRGGGLRRLPASLLDLASSDDPETVLALDDAIRRLEEQDPDAAQVVRLRFFVGLSVDETAEVLEVSRRTVLREWSYARAWLYRILQEDAGEPSERG